MVAELELVCMKNSTAQSSHRSSEKRDPGFVKIRRGLLEHWPEMSANARSLYVWLHLKAYFSEPKRGWVEASFDDMARGNGWSLKTLQRTIEELEAKPYIEVERATSQYRLTRIKILKYDRGETDSAVLAGDPSNSAVDRFDHTSREGVDRGMDRGVDKFDRTSDRTSPPISQSQRDLQAPKNAVEVKKEKNGKADAVRRPFDAEHHIASRKSFSPSERRKKLEKRLTDKIQKNNNANGDELFDDEHKAFAYIEYGVRDPRGLACGFVFVVGDVYYDHKKELPPPGILCSKIIDRCMSEQKSCRTLGSDPSEYFWPPDFQEHRDRLRERERLAEKVRP